MTGLVSLGEAYETIHAQAAKAWPQAVCAELKARPLRFKVGLRPGITGNPAVKAVGYDVVHDWKTAWVEANLPVGASLESQPLRLEGVEELIPLRLVSDLDGAFACTSSPQVDLARARALAQALTDAGATVTPPLLRKAYKLSPLDADILCGVVTWLASHDDVSSWTARQLPVPGIHTKWVETHRTLLRLATGRDIHDELLPRPSVVHLTYTDPDYLSAGGRRHDAWTTGDAHQIAYHPTTVLVVENRDSRLWFPPTPETIVVEGAGKAAAALLAQVPWIRSAAHVVYWGDLDADGFSILDHLRSALAEPAPSGPPHELHSVLMEATTLHRYSTFGVTTGKDGKPLRPVGTSLSHLTASERDAYDAVRTAGDASVRRIEQELIPLSDAATELSRRLFVRR